MTPILKITDLDTGALRAALESHTFLFDQIKDRQTVEGSAHRDTETIFLRWARTLTLDAVFNEIPAVDFPAYQILSAARPLVEKIYQAVEGEELGRLIIVKLAPRGKITPHIDEGAYADHYERFHLPIDSEKGNYFFVASDEGKGVFVSMQNGELYWFNHKKTHAAVNFSHRPRVHLIVDIKARHYRRERE